MVARRKKAAPKPAVTAAAPPTEIAFDYIKSHHYRVVHVDGCWGGVTPSSGISVSFFSERLAIPQKVVHSLDGIRLGPEKRDRREGRTAIIREVEIGLVFDLERAVAIHQWLGQKIQEAQQANAQVASMIQAAPATPHPASAPLNGASKPEKKTPR